VPVSLSIHSNIREYTAAFEETADFLGALAELPQACFAVDENVWKLYRSSLLQAFPEKDVVVVPIHEDRKNLETVQTLYDQLVLRPAKRNLTLVSIGGGILQDISGFAASTIYRGIHWIFVPTTLLAQADSCIGSKTSLNYAGYKNLLGTFYPPERIHIHPPFLQTLSDGDYASGLGEVVKLYLMGGEADFRSLIDLAPALHQRDHVALATAIRRSLAVKQSYMEGDEFDLGRRNLLNFGHDFGHALESTSEFAVPHGQAVVFGMLAANRIAVQRGLLSAHLADEIAEAVLLPTLVVRPAPADLDAEKMILAMQKDKKRTGDRLALIMMKDGFDFIRTNDIAFDEVRACLDELRRRWNF
jgi:3-dehydroquinate synthase